MAMEGPGGPRVWIVNADHWPRAYLRAELIERGYDATGFETVQDAIGRLRRARALRPALLIVDLHDQTFDDDSRAALLRAGVPILVVADATHADDGRLGPPVETLRRPLTIGAIADAVDRRRSRA